MKKLNSSNRKQTYSLMCPFCKKKLSEQFIVSEAARINGRKSKRKLTSEDARKMQKKQKMTSEEASRRAKLGWIKRKQR